uniref:Uncharacterized protein n=1 Tax=Avena sativa TaxID=4498 RepID=A0ACD5UVH9_AVESA
MPPAVNRIGTLPDRVLHYLLSFLPVQEAVRTCVLPHDICLHYSHSGVFCGTNDVKCVSCLYNDGSSDSSVLLGALDNAKHLKLMSPSGMIIFTRDLKWCPTFHNLRNLLLNDYWCVGPDFSALTCILKHSPVLEELTLQLVSEGVRPNVEMKGSYIRMERSTVIPQHLKIVNVKCNVVDEKVVKVLKFLCTLNHCPAVHMKPQEDVSRSVIPRRCTT